jgi:cyclic di-GMP phosphodiesterase
MGMIKKIQVAQLRQGMYIHDLNCDWLEHPFPSACFRLDSGEVLEQIRRLGIRELYIDTTKGQDVAQAPTEQKVTRTLERELAHGAAARPPQGGPRVPLAEERARAERIQQEATRVVSGLMEDARLGRQIEVERVNPLLEQIVGCIFRNQDALIGLTRIRRMDRYTFEHSVSVAVLMVSFARALGLDQEVIREIGVGALLHDVGKTRVPGHILNKPGRLTDAEFQVMRRHVVYSREILAAAPGVSAVALAVVAEHHERSDGTGYPNGKAEAAISRYGQMAAIVDVYDAITSDRVYHKGLEPHEGLRKLLEWSCHHFNAQLVQHFIQCVGIYPIGSLVRLQSGRLGVVVESGRQGLLYPVVRVVMEAGGRRLPRPRDLDLSDSAAGGDRITGTELPERWKVRPEVVLQQVP